MKTKRIVVTSIVALVAAVVVVPFLVVKMKGGVSPEVSPSVLEEECARIHREGLPVTLAELDAWYRISGPNAADLLMQAFAAYVPPGNDICANLPLDGDAELPPRGRPLAPEMISAMQTHLDRNRRTIALLHEGAAMGECRYPVNLADGPEAVRDLLDHIGPLRNAVRLLCEEAILQAEYGNGPRATEALVAVLGLGLDALDRVLCRVALANPELAELSAVLSTAGHERTLWRAYVGERCEWITEQKSLPVLGLLRRLIQAAQMEPSRVQGAVADIESEAARMVKTHTLTFAASFAVVKSYEPEVRTLALFRAALAAVNVLRYYNDSGKAPESLDQLVPTYLPAVPLDPYDARPLRYRKETARFVVYSIGKNLRDDGGIENPDLKPAWEHGDLTFGVELRLGG